RAGSPLVVIINETMARRRWPDRDPIGQPMTVIDRNENDAATSRTIVGIVADVRHPTHDRDPEPQLYVPVDQAPSLWATVAVRLQAGAELSTELGAIVDRVDRNVPVDRTYKVSDRVARTAAPRRFIATLLGGFAAIAVLLTVVGVGGMTSYAVAQRTQEIGVRVALGATSGDVLRLVLGATLRVAAVGTAAGLAGAVATTRLIGSLLFGVTPLDAPVFLIGAV